MKEEFTAIISKADFSSSCNSSCVPGIGNESGDLVSSFRSIVFCSVSSWH